MAMNSPSGPIEATRNARMTAAVTAAHDREKAHNALDERERDQLEQEERRLDQHMADRAKGKRGPFRRLRNRLSFR